MIAPAPAGGAESVVLALAAARRSQTEVAALVRAADHHPFLQNAGDRDIPVTAIPSGRRRYFAEARAVSRLARERGAQLLHTHVYHADLVGYLASRRMGIPVVATVHGFTRGDWKNRLYERFNRWLLRRFDAVVVVSTQLETLMVRSGVRADRVHMIPNGYDPRPTLDREQARNLLGLENDGPTVGWVGRLSEEKGPDLLLDAVDQMGRNDLTVVFVGDGPERDHLAARAAQATYDMRFAGTLPNTAALFSAFDAMVISSRTEGTPMVLLEAMGARVPVVAFGVGGIPDVLGTDAGWLVPADDVDALAESIAAALTNPIDAARRCEKARTIVTTQFGIESWVARLEKVYAAVT